MKKRIVVAMSGGVDSSTVAAILAEQGHEVIGVTLQLYDYSQTPLKKGTCCAGIDIYDAKLAADKIGIPHYVLNYESKFKESVIDDFVDSYTRGQTPIPCVRCNQSVKFKDLYKFAKDLNADALATGHYVQKKINENSEAELHQGNDPNKDQSYFLFATTKEQLEFLEFPIGGLSKAQTRELAKNYGLLNAEKPDSQDICFVPDGDYAAVVKKLRPNAFEPGDIVDTSGRKLGTHQGIINFTIGQRKGLGLSHPTPLYVVKIIPDANIVVVGSENDLKSTKFFITEINWLINPGNDDIIGSARIRSSHKGCEARARKINNDLYEVTLFEPQKSVTPGQACVFYDGTRLLGGGFIINKE